MISHYFCTYYIIILDNNDVDEDMMMQVFKRVRRLANKKVQNGRGKAWISQQLQMKKRA